MCGRFAFYSPHEAVTRLFGVAAAAAFEPRYNIAPTQFVTTVREAGGPREFLDAGREAGAGEAGGEPLRVGARAKGPELDGGGRPCSGSSRGSRRELRNNECEIRQAPEKGSRFDAIGRWRKRSDTMPKDKMILYYGDTTLREAGSYRAGVMAHCSITFDYLASHQRFKDEFLFRAYRGIVLSDYPAINFTPGQLMKLTEKVRQGMGFLMIGGWASFTGANREYTETVLRETLPVIWATSPGDFHRLDGSTVEVPMMHQEELLGYAAGEGVQALEPPYVSGGMSMLILLPDEGRFEAFQDGLSAQALEAILSGLSYRPVVLSLPKFTYVSAFSLNNALKELGMPDAFDPDRADFSGMDGARDLYISNVLHKAFVAVDEKGTEAVAATAVIMEVTSASADEPIIVRVDRPFIYLMRDTGKGSVLFLGRVLDPSA